MADPVNVRLSSISHASSETEIERLKDKGNQIIDDRQRGKGAKNVTPGMTTRIGPGFRTVDVLELDLSGR